jgi:hypothetical protein
MKNVTNRELAVKLDLILTEFRDHRQEFKEHVKLDADTRDDVMKLVVIEEGRRWQIRTLWAGVTTALIGLIVKFVWPTG